MGKDSYISNVSFHGKASPMSILWKGLVWKEEGKKRLPCVGIGRSNEGGLDKNCR